jgi:enamine deaminase RidA (YjgF/YER057c/UK114 family)
VGRPRRRGEPAACPANLGLSLRRGRGERSRRSPRYANIVVAGGFAYIAGQTAFDEQGNVVGVGDIDAQCERALQNRMICLRAVNATPSQIVKVTNYVTDRAYLANLVEIDAIVHLG